MTILSWFFVVSYSIFLIIFCTSLFSFIGSYLTHKNLDRLNQKKPKDKPKQKRWLYAKRRLKIRKKTQIKRGFILLILSVLFMSVGTYAHYYESTNLSSTDGNIIVQSYFITDEVNKQLLNIQENEQVAEPQEKLMELSSLLTSYGSAAPSNNLGKEEQRLLTRYYVQLRDYGTNLYSLTPEQFKKKEIISSYRDDLKRIKQTQKKIFNQFNVNETALKQKK